MQLIISHAYHKHVAEKIMAAGVPGELIVIESNSSKVSNALAVIARVLTSNFQQQQVYTASRDCQTNSISNLRGGSVAWEVGNW